MSKARVKRLQTAVDRLPVPDPLDSEPVDLVIVHGDGGEMHFTGPNAEAQARAACPECFGPDSIGVTVPDGAR